MKDLNKHLRVWALDTPPPQDVPVLLWNSFSTEELHPDSISLPRFIEENAEQVRARLLRFFYEARFIEVGSTSLESALLLPQGLSSWWLTFPSLKQWGQRYTIPLACRFVALEMIVGPSNLSRLELISDDNLMKKLWGQVLIHDSRFRRRPSHQLASRFIHPLRAVGSALRYLFHSRVLDDTQSCKQIKSDGDIAVFDYLSGDTFGGQVHPYYSPYWGAFTDLSSNRTWFHVFPRNIEKQAIKKTIDLIKQLNSGPDEQHVLFLGRIGLMDLLRIGRNFLHQFRIHGKFRQELNNFQLAGSKLQLWRVFTDEWDDSVIGSTAIRHLILLYTTDRFATNMPQFKKIYYLMENQPWEVALTHSVRRHGKGELIGVAHSTIRYWDLRYFADPHETSSQKHQFQKPGPDRVLVNSHLAQSLLRDSGFPSKQIGVVEALRYTYLDRLRSVDRVNRDVVVLLGDFLEHANSSLLSLFRQAYSQLEHKPNLMIRSHPICPLTEEQLGELRDHISDESLPELLQVASLVITTAASSSAAEAAALGIPTAVVLDGSTLNYSPFRESNEVHTVVNSHQLATFLAMSSKARPVAKSSIFVLDSRYPLWRAEIAR